MNKDRRDDQVESTAAEIIEIIGFHNLSAAPVSLVGDVLGEVKVGVYGDCFAVKCLNVSAQIQH